MVMQLTKCRVFLFTDGKESDFMRSLQPEMQSFKFLCVATLCASMTSDRLVYQHVLISREFSPGERIYRLNSGPIK